MEVINTYHIGLNLIIICGKHQQHGFHSIIASHLLAFQLLNYFHSFSLWYHIPDFKTNPALLVPSWLLSQCHHFPLCSVGATEFVSCFPVMAHGAYHLTRVMQPIMSSWKLQQYILTSFLVQFTIQHLSLFKCASI